MTRFMNPFILQELYNDLYFHKIHAAVMAKMLMKKLYSISCTGHESKNLDLNLSRLMMA